MSAKWIIAHDGTQPGKPFGVECKRCGEYREISRPILLAKFLAEVIKFQALHERCKHNKFNVLFRAGEPCGHPKIEGGK